VVLGKSGGEQLDGLCEKQNHITFRQEGQEQLAYNKMKEGKNGLFISNVGKAI
jgi:hypothetical protein